MNHRSQQSESFPIQLGTQVVAHEESVSCGLDGETIVLSLSEGLYHALGGVGSRIWDLLQREGLLSGILDTLLLEFEVEPGRCQQELLVFVEELRRAGLVRVVSHAG
jgi:hypothetical protein